MGEQETMTAGTVEVSRYHQPCWKLELDDVDYLVWAPGPIMQAGQPTGRIRERWASNWVGDEGDSGDYAQGATLEQVLAIFPAHIAQMFREVIQSTHG